MWYLERIDAYIDAELNQAEQSLFEGKLAIDTELQQAVKDARQLRTALADLPQLKCPKRVTDKVFEMTETSPVPIMRWLPATAGIAAALVLSVSLWLPGHSSNPSTAELAKAQQDFELAMGYLEKASQSATRHVGAQWVNGGIVAPVNRGLDQRQRALTKDVAG